MYFVRLDCFREFGFVDNTLDQSVIDQIGAIFEDYEEFP